MRNSEYRDRRAIKIFQNHGGQANDQEKMNVQLHQEVKQTKDEEVIRVLSRKVTAQLKDIAVEQQRKKSDYFELRNQ